MATAAAAEARACPSRCSRGAASTVRNPSIASEKRPRPPQLEKDGSATKQVTKQNCENRPPPDKFSQILWGSLSQCILSAL